MIEDVEIRLATVQDIPDLVRLRRIMFEAMGYDDKTKLDKADQAAKEFFIKAIPEGSFWGWVAITNKGDYIGSGGVVIDQHPPCPHNLTGQIGYIMNLVTIPEFRRHGIARKIMQSMVQWLVKKGIKTISLHSTEMGKTLYEELGFVESNEMILHLKEDFE